MEITFGTKKENNNRRQEAFLKLPPAERVMQFIKLSNQMATFPSQAPKPDKGNFVIQLYSKTHG